jgi:hypothetical protein
MEWLHKKLKNPCSYAGIASFMTASHNIVLLGELTTGTALAITASILAVLLPEAPPKH